MLQATWSQSTTGVARIWSSSSPGAMLPGAGAVQVVGPCHQPALHPHVIDADPRAVEHHEPREQRQPCAAARPG